MDFPEHDKLVGLNGANNTVGRFLEWLESENILLAKWEDDGDHLYPHRETIESILYRHFRIDPDKIEQEKQQMIEQLRGA